jgi:hypothetical protein
MCIRDRWEDSGTTDFSYAYVRGEVFVSLFGSSWVEARRAMRKGFEWPEDRAAIFPTMDTSRAADIGSKRNGMIIMRAP